VLKYALVGQTAQKESLLERLAAMVHATSRTSGDGPTRPSVNT